MTLAYSLASNARAMQKLQDDLPARNTARFFQAVSTPAVPPPEQDPTKWAILAVVATAFFAGIMVAFVGGLVPH